MIGEEGIIGSAIFRGLKSWGGSFRYWCAMVSSCGGTIEKCVSMVAKAAKGIDSEGE